MAIPRDWEVSKMSNYSTNELMAVTASRLLKDGQNVVVGLGLPQIATVLAQYTHAPSLNIIYEIGVVNPILVDMGVGIADSRLWYQADYFTSFVGSLGGLLQKGLVDVGFLGGLQVDQFGNLNTTLVKTEHGIRHFTGSGGGGDIATYSKNIYVIMKHEKRKIVNFIDYITSVGYYQGKATRKEIGLPKCNSIKIITNLCVFGFSEEEKKMQLDSIHPGVSMEQVKENTEASFLIPAKVETTGEPSKEEIELLEKKIDPDHQYI
jgi:acyl CoA:acetate/3-ketoacid CoA transferase beta subunit